MENTFELLGIVAVPAITIICFLVGWGVKASPIDDRFIPLICGVFGGLLGLLALKVMPTFPDTDVISAFATGAVSGLGATGLHQVFKQLTKPKEDQ